MMPAFFVIRQRDTDPVEVYPFESRADADAFYDQASAQWSDVWLTYVVRGPAPTSGGGAA